MIFFNFKCIEDEGEEDKEEVSFSSSGSEIKFLVSEESSNEVSEFWRIFLIINNNLKFRINNV